MNVHQILVDQRHHRDLAQVDLLIARQAQQQVERPLESFQVDDQLALAWRDHVRTGRRESVGGGGSRILRRRRAGGFGHAVPV
jgi:hypothetical protein